jgi:hypothetical protein
MNINTVTGLFYDKEEQTTLDKNNDRLFNRMINTKGLISDNYNSITNNVGLYQTNRSGMLRKIDNESNLLNGKVGNVLTSGKSRKQKILKTRTFVGNPLKKSIIHKEMNADVSSELLRGKLIKKSKLTDKLSGISINRFTPLVPKLKKDINGFEHSVNTFNRTGKNTRNNLRSIRFDNH